MLPLIQGKHRPRNSRVPMLAQMRDVISSEKLSTNDLENIALFLKSQRVYKVHGQSLSSQRCRD